MYARNNTSCNAHNYIKIEIMTKDPGVIELQSSLLSIALTSPALEWQSDRGGRNNYPANYRGRVPLKVRVAKKVEPDLPWLKKTLGVKEDTVCLKDHEYYVWVNSYGAVSAILPGGEKLGLLPSEFDVIEWHGQ
jgi:hypothetical protein